MMRSLALISVSLALASTATSQPSDKPKLASEYQGVWAVNGACDDTAFVFSATFIERASADICYIDQVQKHGQGVRVVATCWHEGMSVGQSTYDLVRKSDNTLIFADRPDLTIKNCGPVPQKLIEAYTQADR